MILLAAVLLWTRRRRDAILIALALGLLWVGAGVLALAVELRRAAARPRRAGRAALEGRGRCWPGPGSPRRSRSGSCCSRPPRSTSRPAASKELDRATSGRANLIGGGLRMVRDRPVVRLRLGLVRRALPRARARQLREGRRGLAHDPADGDGRAGRDRPRRVPGAGRALARAAVRRAAQRDDGTLAGRRRDRARRARRRLLRARPPHPRVRRVPGGSAVVGAAGDRGRAARARRSATKPPAEPRAGAWRRRGHDARPPRVRADAAGARAPAVRRARAHDDPAAARRARRRSPSRSSSCARAWTGSARSSTATTPAFTLQYRNDLFHSTSRRSPASSRGSRAGAAASRSPSPSGRFELTAPRGRRRARVPARSTPPGTSSGSPSTSTLPAARRASRARARRARLRGPLPHRPRAAATRSGATSCSCRATRRARAACC